MDQYAADLLDRNCTPHADGDPGAGRNAERDFHGEKRSNATHESTTDPEARLYRKGNRKDIQLCYMGHALMENRNGLAVGGGATQASGTAERDHALAQIDGRRGGPVASGGITLGGDKAFDVAGFVGDLRARRITPHIAVDDHVTKTGKRRKTAIDRRTTHHPGYDIPQRCGKRIEEVLAWIKTTAGLGKTRFRGQERVNAAFTLALAAYNLIRLPKLLEAPT